MKVTRRDFLREGAAAGVTAASAGALLQLGCRMPSAAGDPLDAADAAPDGVGPGDAAGLDATPECAETADNVVGPFYRPGAPERSDLADAGLPGTRLTVSGRVIGFGCMASLPGALLDVWQADDAGHYDNDGLVQPPPPPALYLLRGRVLADAQGGFTFRTIIPGHYLDGSSYRPAHIHVTASAAGHRPVTTQLYFEGDPYNDTDPFILPPLIMRLEDAPGNEKAARFDFVLRPL